MRGQIERIETAEVVHQRDRVALGHGEVDSALKGGLARAAIHEVFCEGRQGAAATGFVMGLAGRDARRRPLLWVRQDFSELETGALSMSGLAEIGLDPRRVVMVRAADVGERAAHRRPMRSPATRSAPSCSSSGARRGSSISWRAAS